MTFPQIRIMTDNFTECDFSIVERKYYRYVNSNTSGILVCYGILDVDGLSPFVGDTIPNKFLIC